jgi:hypothetical protein
MLLRRIGYWKAEFRDGYPAPQWIADQAEASDSQRVAAYLESGWAASWSPGLSWCRFGCGYCGASELSDGVWLWPDGLVHYVREHHVALPAEFIVHVRQNREPARLQEGEEIQVDETDWLRWAAELTTPARQARIWRAEAAWIAEVAAVIDPEVERLERSVGIAEKPCAAEGCTGRRLRSGPMCSRCFAVGMARGLPSEHDALVEFLRCEEDA